MDEQQVAQVISDSLKARITSEHHNNPYSIHPTDIANCMRKTWYERKWGQVITLTDYFIMERGNMIHHSIQKLLSSNKQIITQHEARVGVKIGEYSITASVDTILNNQVILEYKTTKHLPVKSNLLHEMQVNAYQFLTKLDEAYLVYISVQPDEKWKFSIFTVNRLQDETPLVRRFDTLYNHLKNDTLPEKEIHWGLCHFCPFIQYCNQNIKEKPL